MKPSDFIGHKCAGRAHAKTDLETFVTGYVGGEVPDYQMSAWLMAVCWQGMTEEETTALTEVLAQSGDTLDLSSLSHTVDKHSTGGVGDKTSLVLAPLLASCGVTVAKMSGRGLGHTGGTVDKLESIPGFRSTLSEQAFLEQAESVGVVISGQSKDLAPADGLIYALRDATATVQSLPLIASSIMSKKLASGAKSIVLDVKVGAGAFMKTLEEAGELAGAMIDIGRRSGRNMRAVLSSMDQPLGFAVGNSLEMQEAIACLQGGGPGDLRELCVTLAQEVLSASGMEHSREALGRKLDDGDAFEVFKRWIAAQGGAVERLGDLELAPDRDVIYAPQGGYLASMDALAVGRAVKGLGGGREQKQDPIDMGVGVQLHVKVGDKVGAGEPLLTLYHRGGRGLAEAKAFIEAGLEFSATPVKAPPLIYKTLS